MKLVSLAFIALLIYAHQIRGWETSLHQPLSDFREGEYRLVGYALFCAIALIGVLYTVALKRFEEPGELANTAGFGVVFLIVAATPSGWTLHDASAIVLLGSICAYFAVVLHRSGHPLMMLIHLSVPILLAIVTGFQSYGIWQKGLICYLVLAAVAHHHVVCRRTIAPACNR